MVDPLDDAADFQKAFWATKRVMARASERAFKRHGIGSGEQFILQTLWEQDGLTPGEVAHSLSLSVPTVTRAASRLEAADLVNRVAHETDGRLVRLRLTEQGKRIKRAVDRERRGLSAKALQSLSPSERELLVDLLNRIRQDLSRYLED